MKNIWKFGIGMVFSIGLLVSLSIGWEFGDQQIPPPGNFLNPFTGFWNLAESGKSGSHENIPALSIKDTIQIEFDKRFVPYIYSQTREDAFYAQGYLHARYRLFQMDLTSRSILGTLSEILGPATLEKDIFARRINFPLAVENKLKSWEKHPQVYRMMEAYVNGVNDYLSTLSAKNYPIEYKLIDAAPEKWSVEKTAAISISLAATLNLNLQDIHNTNTLLALGSQLYHDLFPRFPEDVRPIITDKNSYPDSVPDMPVQNYHNFDYLKIQDPPVIPPGRGSNNWAVSANKTRDSVPLLANDPHLQLTLPNIWYELQIHSPEFGAHGVSVPGMPGIVIGFNSHIAWGLTNSAIDVLDTYKIDWADIEKNTYWLDGIKTEASLRKEIIKIKGKKDHEESVTDTYWGPILYPSHPIQDNHHDIAVKWVSSLPDERADIYFLLGLMESTSLEDFNDALHHFYIPGQNIIFASVDDSIALKVQGKFPIKKPEQGRFVLDGSSRNNDWHGFIPEEDLPYSVNPPEGYLLSANEWPVYSDYPYYYSGRFNHYRGRTIDALLKDQNALTPEMMKTIQKSLFNLQAAETIPLLLSFLSDEEKQHPMADSLKVWNHEYDPDSPLPVLAEFWINECLRLTFDELQVIDEIPHYQPEVWRLKELLQHRPYDRIFNITKTDKRETAKDIVRMSWKNALSKYDELPTSERLWGKQNALNINHLLGLPHFSHQNLFTGGDKNSINAISKTHGPSWRMIVELHPDSVLAHVVYPGGQSGNPGSYYYDNFINHWITGKYYTVKIFQKPDKIDHKMHYSLNMIPR